MASVGDATLEAERLGAVRHLGPRELTFCFDATGQVLTNCAKCPGLAGIVAGGCFSDPAQPPSLLTRGWHEIYVTADSWVQQLPPSELCTADPQNCGMFMRAGTLRRFYVNNSCIDGGIAVLACSATSVPACGYSGCVALAIVNRDDAVIQIPIDSSSSQDRLPVASNPSACEPP